MNSHDRQALELIEILIETNLSESIAELEDFTKETSPDTPDPFKDLENILDNYYVARRAYDIWSTRKTALEG